MDSRRVVSLGKFLTDFNKHGTVDPIKKKLYTIPKQHPVTHPLSVDLLESWNGRTKILRLVEA